jgi:hypothetical protein
VSILTILRFSECEGCVQGVLGVETFAFGYSGVLFFKKIQCPVWYGLPIGYTGEGQGCGSDCLGVDYVLPCCVFLCAALIIATPGYLRYVNCKLYANNFS